MAAKGKTLSLSDTSSSDDESHNARSATLNRNKRPLSYGAGDHDEASNPKRQSVIVRQGSNSFSSANNSTSNAADDQAGNVLPVHKTFFKSKLAPEPLIDQKAKAMMAKMGFREGAGLGKTLQGIAQPIEVSKQRGRRGLGMQVKGLEAEEVEWDSSREVVEVEELVTWMPPTNLPVPSLAEMRKWSMEGGKKLTIENESNFCDREILRQVLQCKTIFDQLEDEELRKARSRSNPFETIRGGFFLNRAAMKMANLDAVFDFIFTEPKTEAGLPWLASNELLYFADVCAGPGGFTEYILWRKKWGSKGFGFTLKGSNDFKLEDFHAAPSECFEPHYGVGGIDGDGNVYTPENINEFRQFVLSRTGGKGVHFMMADGGFSVEGQENLQEILSKRLYLCQFLVALAIVRNGGHFVCKLFDVFTPFSAGLIYLMYRSFKQISIHKPNTSRPANSERYVICKWKRSDTHDVEAYLYEINLRLDKLSSPNCKTDILQIVPLDILTNDQGFYDYLTESNNALGMRQMVNLAKIAAYCKDVTLREDRQSELRKQCLDFWKIPDKARTAPPRIGPNDKANELLASNSNVLGLKPNVLSNTSVLNESIKSVYDWRCIVLGLEIDNPMQTFFLGLGRNNVFRWDSVKYRWQKMTENIEFPSSTLVYGELIQELRGEGRSQKRSYSLHIIDAFFLGGIDVSQLHLIERSEKIQQFAEALNKTSRTDLVVIRAKESFKLEDVDQIFNRLVPRIIKNSGCQERLVFSLDDSECQRAFLPSGLLLLKATKSPWMLALSKSSGRKYWFHVMMRSSSYECPRDSITTFSECHSDRLVWWWKFGLAERDRNSNNGDLTKDDFLSFVHHLLNGNK